MSDTNEPNSVVDWASVQMSPRAQGHYQRYLQWIEQRHREMEKTPLIVLIWGPGPSGGALYKKRLEIRGKLRQLGDVAVFSEEVDSELSVLSGPMRARELIQAHGADLIVILYGSPGAIAETHDFGNFLQQLGSKMLVFIDSNYTSGYGYSGLLDELKCLYGNVHAFEFPKDIDECHLLGMVEARLKILRFAKWWSERIRE